MIIEISESISKTNHTKSSISSKIFLGQHNEKYIKILIYNNHNYITLQSQIGYDRLTIFLGQDNKKILKYWSTITKTILRLSLK